ncbi:MAG: zinc-binding dehydrogenase, partial [Verrucomicrobiales bacterium]|nr:zinc-binding dehydrogenase [Verrucomicrobiales bacterium]
AGAAADRTRLVIAQELRAKKVVNVNDEDLLKAVQHETDGFGVDVVFECAGAPASAANCLNALRPLGRYTQVGHFGKEITLPFDRVGFKQLRVSGSVGYTAESWRRALSLLDQGAVRLGDMITHKLPLTEWRRGFDLCEQKEALKVLLQP